MPHVVHHQAQDLTCQVRETLVLQENSELTELFDLESSEELLERFACALLQTYSCSHNEFTPEQKVSHVFCQLLQGLRLSAPSA